MRASAATIVGLLAGGALGFLLHGLFAGDASRPEAEAGSRPAASAAAHALPAVPPSAAEPLSTARIASAPTALATEADAIAAANPLVGIVVFGAVTEPDGTPVRLGDRHWIYFDNGLHERRSVQLSTSTFAVSGLVPGNCRIRTDLSGYRPDTHELELDAATPSVRVDLVVQPSVELVIRAFTPSGDKLDDALLPTFGDNPFDVPLAAVATRAPPPAALPEMSFRIYDQWEIGRYRPAFEQIVRRTTDIPADAIGKLELESLPAYVSLMFRHLVVQTQPVEPGATEVRFVVSLESLTALLGGVRLKVIDSETRQPLAGARAELSDSQSGGGDETADAEGVIVWDRQKPGRLELQLSAPEHEQWNGVVSVPSGGVADLGTLELTPATTVAGRVLTADGQPVSLQLRALVDEGRELGMGERTYNRSGADGRFECKNLGRRSYVLLVSGDEWTALPVAVDLRHGPVEGVAISVTKGTRVQLHSGWPATESRAVRLVTPDGLTVWDADEFPGDWTWTERLVPGEYIAILSRDGIEARRLPVQVGATDQSIELSP